MAPLCRGCLCASGITFDDAKVDVAVLLQEVVGVPQRMHAAVRLISCGARAGAAVGAHTPQSGMTETMAGRLQPHLRRVSMQTAV